MRPFDSIRAATALRIDRAFGGLLRYGKLYRDGFGDRDLLARVIDSVETYGRDRPIQSIDVRLGATAKRGGIERALGEFDSPSSHLLVRESRRARFELLTPKRGPIRGACVVLAATAEEGFTLRRVFASALVREGIAALVLENVFYGTRRPRGQEGPAIRTVAEQFVMNLVTVDEARSLLAYARAQLDTRVAATGYSQGGMMAAFAGALAPFDVAVIPRGAGASTRSIFIDSALSLCMDWDKLAAEAGGLEQARRIFSDALAPVDLRRKQPPRVPRACIIASARHDGFVPAAEAEALHAHWAGSELRLTNAGHLTFAVLHNETHRSAVRDALSRLPHH